jgi:hypothetical protein
MQILLHAKNNRKKFRVKIWMRNEKKIGEIIWIKKFEKVDKKFG